jgi:hypothetical protein
MQGDRQVRLLTCLHEKNGIVVIVFYVKNR